MPYSWQRARTWFLGALFMACLCAPASAELKPDLDSFKQEVQPLLKRYCVRCHSGEEPEAEIRLDKIDPDILDGEHFDRWEDIREAFNTGEMPPEKQPQPTASERDAITRWLDAEFKKVKLQGKPNHRGRVRRLTRYELGYALEDLLHFSAQEEVNTLPAEGTSLETGLQNSSRLLMISGPHLESYLDVIIGVTDRMKKIAAFEPHSVTLELATMDLNPPERLGPEGRKHKPVVGKVDREGKGVTVNPGGYIDLPLKSISQYMFQTSVLAKAGGAGKLQVAIGFTRSEADPRQVVRTLGELLIEPGGELRSYTLNSYPEELPREMTRALDRPFFIRITNRGGQKIYLEAFDYRGNVNSELTAKFVPAEIAEEEVNAHIRRQLHYFVEKAFRRSPSEAEITKYYSVYQRHAKNKPVVVALLDTHKEILCSPNFFYLGLAGELDEEAHLNYKLAERLAFFLWCSVPDDSLLKAAAAGELSTPEALEAQIERMLADPKATRWVEQFTDQWLQTDKLFNVAVDKGYYPGFKDSLKDMMRQETVAAVNDVFRNGASALELLDADHVFVNQQLAGFYKLPRVRGDEFRKVEIGEKDHRGGLLTQGTFLVGNSDGMNSHAIMRGVWLAEVILNDPPPDPPKNVPPLDENIPGFDKMTLNEKLFAHRDNAACRSCHNRIDPWGVPFENYDASGAWREKVLVISKAADQPKKQKKPVFEKSFVEIDRKSSLPDGEEIDGIGELKQYLVSHRKRDFAHGLTERILAYALSRDIDYHDEDLVNQLCDNFEKNDYSVPALIREIVLSKSFQRGT